jgi:hypothetical protein
LSGRYCGCADIVVWLSNERNFIAGRAHHKLGLQVYKIIILLEESLNSVVMLASNAVFFQTTITKANINAFNAADKHVRVSCRDQTQD